MNKKLRDFYFKHESMRAFLRGLEKRDERYVISALRTIEFEAGERVIRSGTKDKSVLFVAGGELIIFSYDGAMNDQVYQTGAVLGIEQFLFDKPWEYDILCNMQATVCKLTYENLLNLISANALAASRLYKRIMRHYCYMQIYEKKKQNIGVINFFEIDDSDLFIDFKLDFYNNKASNKDPALFQLLHQYRDDSDRNRDEYQKGKEHDTMPYFLSHQYKAILQESKDQKQAAEDEENGVVKKGKKEDGPVGIYKSEFLRKKVEDQVEKKKRDRKQARGKPVTQESTAALATTEPAKKKGNARPRTENEEQLL